MLMVEQDQIYMAAVGLLQCNIHGVERVRGGGNNEIFRIETERGPFALKRYIVSGNDTRDRIGHEFDALTLLANAGESAVPRPVAADRNARIAIYEWVGGVHVERLERRDIEAALAFVERLHAYRNHALAIDLPLAAEACVDAESLHAHIRTRLNDLAEGSATDTRLAAFLDDRFIPAWQRVTAHIGSTNVVAREFQTLSPSDFGAHNMLRRADGELMFLDFEYFGWDDPVKLVADVVWHPGSALCDEERDRFIVGSARIFAKDPDYARRFALRVPLFGLRWALIVLAEFIPQRWERRQRAGERRNWEVVKARQLAKAADFVDRALRSLT